MLKSQRISDILMELRMTSFHFAHVVLWRRLSTTLTNNYFKVAPDPQKPCLPFSGKYRSLSDSQLICLASTCNSNWGIRPFLLHAPAQIFLNKSNMLFYWHSGTHRKLVIKIWDVIMNFKVKAPLTLAGSWQSCYQEYFETKSNGNAVSPRFSCV